MAIIAIATLWNLGAQNARAEEWQNCGFTVTGATNNVSCDTSTNTLTLGVGLGSARTTFNVSHYDNSAVGNNHSLHILGGKNIDLNVFSNLILQPTHDVSPFEMDDVEGTVVSVSMYNSSKLSAITLPTSSKAAVHVPSNAQIIVDMGQLEATAGGSGAGGTTGAGIGGNGDEKEAGLIYLRGGNGFKVSVSAQSIGGDSDVARSTGAAIGGGGVSKGTNGEGYGRVKQVYISGDVDVTAKTVASSGGWVMNHNCGAGIGGGGVAQADGAAKATKSGGFDKITIDTLGSVSATSCSSRSGGAGIGTGASSSEDPGAFGELDILNGTITATGGDQISSYESGYNAGAGIGYGATQMGNQTAGVINIKGGTIIATGGQCLAAVSQYGGCQSNAQPGFGIGGNQLNRLERINITRGNVYSYGWTGPQLGDRGVNSIYTGTLADESRPVNAFGQLLYPVYIPTTLNSTNMVGGNMTIANSAASTNLPLSSQVADKLTASANACGSNLACAGVAWLPAYSTDNPYTSYFSTPVVQAQLKAIVKSIKNPIVAAEPSNSKNVVFVSSTTLDNPEVIPPGVLTATQGQDYIGTVSATGGGITSIALTGSLPSGLKFDTTTGVISGAVDENAPAGDYQLTASATNSKGTTSKDFTLTVLLGLPAASVSHPDPDGEGPLLPANSTVVQVNQPAVSAPRGSQPISYCISATASTTYSTDDSRCAVASANWVTPASNSAATLTLDLATLTGSDTYTFGAPRTFTIFARNYSHEVYQGRNISIQMNKVTFHSNGDGVQYTPTLPAVSDPNAATDWVNPAPETNPADGSSVVRYLTPEEELQTALPAEPTLHGWTANGWAFNSISPTTGCPFGDTSTWSDPNSPGKEGGNCAADPLVASTISTNAEVYAVWDYTPQILDFSPKKGLKNDTTPITVAVYPLIPWGKSLPADQTTLNSATHIYFGSSAAGSPECAGVNILDSNTLSCTMPAAPSADSGELYFKNE